MLAQRYKDRHGGLSLRMMATGHGRTEQRGNAEAAVGRWAGLASYLGMGTHTADGWRRRARTGGGVERRGTHTAARKRGWARTGGERMGSQHLFLPPINFEIDSSIDKNDAFCFEAGFLSVARQVISTAD